MGEHQAGVCVCVCLDVYKLQTSVTTAPAESTSHQLVVDLPALPWQDVAPCPRASHSSCSFYRCRGEVEPPMSDSNCLLCLPLT